MLATVGLNFKNQHSLFPWSEFRGVEGVIRADGSIGPAKAHRPQASYRRQGARVDKTIRIAVVDDHPLYRDGVIFTLDSHSDLLVIAQGRSASDAIRIAAEQAPDVIILDMSMPGGGMTALMQITTHCPNVRVLMLTAVGDDDQVRSALRNGARGYLLKGATGEELVRAVRALSAGESFVSPGLAARLLARAGAAQVESGGPERSFGLSGREAQILLILRSGMSNKEIGSQLDLSEKTIKHYVTNILQKLRVRNRVEAAILASEHAGERPSLHA
jgi:DNA-binding NarL/FixJ family response regulator